MTSSNFLRHGRRWLVRPLAVLIVLLSLWFLIGGVMLVTAGGSGYYLVAGIALLVSGVQLWRRKTSGALWFAGVIGVTIVWTIWETGANYWGWVPRLGLLTMIAFLLSLALPALDRGTTRKVAAMFTGLCAVLLIGGASLAFVPHGFIEPSGSIPDQPLAGVVPASDAVPSDWQN
ncbi:hypothetical protein BH09PSE3_BH09PSE3_27650 [soil metagenome]